MNQHPDTALSPGPPCVHLPPPAASNPEFDPWVAAHSCGEVCGKPLSGGCGHSCLLLCHPGPCPPCPLVVDAACYCGRKALKRRCGHNEYSCEGPCGRTLECGHRCGGGVKR